MKLLPECLEEPIRLAVRYRSTRELLREFTRVLGMQSVPLESSRFTPVGTRFDLQLGAADAPEQLRVQAEVVSVTARSLSEFQLSIRYEPQLADRAPLDALLERDFESQRTCHQRRHPRLPLDLRVTSAMDPARGYRIHDLSRGGIRIEVEAPPPPALVVGAPFLFELDFEDGPLHLQGEVIWKENLQFGAAFGRLRPRAEARLEEILLLKRVPEGPWRARLSLGAEAVARMPGSEDGLS